MRTLQHSNVIYRAALPWESKHTVAELRAWLLDKE